jgi:hypothetical protein
MKRQRREPETIPTGPAEILDLASQCQVSLDFEDRRPTLQDDPGHPFVSEVRSTVASWDTDRQESFYAFEGEALGRGASPDQAAIDAYSHTAKEEPARRRDQPRPERPEPRRGVSQEEEIPDEIWDQMYWQK